MCGRMTLTRSGREIADFFSLAMGETEAGVGVEVGADVAEPDGSSLRARDDIAPSQQIATIVRLADGGRAMRWKRWGLVPFWSRDAAIGRRLFNARSETADEKPAFRAAWRQRRCLIIADGFYEWTPPAQGHQPYHFRSRKGPLLGLAGLFEAWHEEGGEVVESCTVLTTEANADLDGIHHRMPVILDPSRFDSWLDPTSDLALLKAMMGPAPAGTLERRVVSHRVDSPRFGKAAQGELFRLEGERTK